MQPPAGPAASPNAPPPRAPGFFERNWRWLLPLGCLGALGGLAIFSAAVVGFVTMTMRSSDVYREAVARASKDPALIAELGAPIESGWFMSGSIREVGPSGEADVSIPLAGPRNEGTLYAVATKSAGVWTFSTLEVEVKGRATRVYVLPPAAAP